MMHWLVADLSRYSPEQLYEVVSNVQHYHQFVPWCVGSTVLTQQQDGRYLEAELQIGFQMISERQVVCHVASSCVSNSECCLSAAGSVAARLANAREGGPHMFGC